LFCRKKAVTKEQKRTAQEALKRWRKSHEDINVLRKAYRERIPDWVVKSMEFESEPVSMTSLKELLEKEGRSSHSPARAGK
jgi:hypothetical protein